MNRAMLVARSRHADGYLRGLGPGQVGGDPRRPPRRRGPGGPGPGAPPDHARPAQGSLTGAPEALALLNTLPGVGQRAAESLLAAIGTDRRRFPRAQPLASWAGMGPGHYERGGKRLSGKTRQGSRGLRQLLVAMAQVA